MLNSTCTLVKISTTSLKNSIDGVCAFSLNQSLVKARGALLRQANAEMDSKDANSHFVLHVHRKSFNGLFLQSIYENIQVAYDPPIPNHRDS